MSEKIKEQRQVQGAQPPAKQAAADGQRPKRVSPSRLKPAPRPIDWEKIADEELLAKRICDLPVRIDGSWIAELIQTVYKELDDKGIHFHPECYLGDEWFTPEGDAVVSIPFYLAHPRLIRLEKSRVLEAEGETRGWFLQLLRHEFAHALSHAYELHRFKGFSRVFGSRSKPYGDTYRPRPYSRSFVDHLEGWYSQAHPDEDFAETFAVWLSPDIDWRKKYEGWPALKKLEFVDRVMAWVRGREPRKRGGSKWRRLSTIRMSIAQYHKIKRKTLEEDFPDYFDRDLKAIFSETKGPTGEKAAKFLRRHRRMLAMNVARWTGERRFTVRSLVTRFAERCQELRLFVQNPEPVTVAQVTACLTAMASNYFMTGKFKRPFKK